MLSLRPFTFLSHLLISQKYLAALSKIYMMALSGPGSMQNTGLLKMTVGFLTTCHTQYT
jgi:hypothetical protein